MPKGIPRNKTVQHRILHRMRIAQGHLDRVVQMTKRGDYCIDIINQSLAVQSALKGIDRLILKNHMETCVADAIAKGNTDEVISEVTKILDRK